MKTFAISLIILMLTAFTSCLENPFDNPYSPPPERWSKRYGGDSSEYLFVVKNASDDGFIIAGASGSFGAGDLETYIIRINRYGEVIWERPYSSEYTDKAKDILYLEGEGYIVAGVTDSSIGEGDISVMKIDLNGNQLWKIYYGNDKGEDVHSICPAPGGGFVIAGSRYNDITDKDRLIVMFDSSGNFLWEKEFAENGYDEFISIIQTQDEFGDFSGYAAAGYVTVSAKSWQHYIVKFHPDGEIDWEYITGGDGSSDLDGSFTIQQSSDKGYIISGFSQVGASLDLYLLKLDQGGDPDWEKIYDTNITNVDEVKSRIIQIDEMSYIAASSVSVDGNTDNNDLYLLKVDNFGEYIWDKSYDGGYTDNFGCMVIAADGDFVLAGTSERYNNGDGDFWVLKLDKNGDLKEKVGE